MFDDKNNKKTAVSTELFELSSCTYGIAPESELSHQPQVQYGFVPKLSRHCGKNIVSLRSTKKAAHCCFHRVQEVQEFKVFKKFLFFSAKRDVFSSAAVCGLEQTHWWLGRSARASSQAQTSEAAMKAAGRRLKQRGF